MRICNVCGVEKSLDLYHRSRDGHQYSCIECANARSKADYQANRERYYDKANQRNKEMRERLRELKSVPCADCGGVFDPVCMDFDHLPQHEKTMDISKMMRKRMAWTKVLAEVAKCEVVCSNCHRLRTRDRLDVA